MSQIKTIAPSAEYPYWLGEVRNNNFQERQPAVIFLPGIGESIAEQIRQGTFKGPIPPQGAEVATRKVITWITSEGDLPAGADKNGFNIVTVAPKSAYESKEIQIAIAYAKEVLKASKIIVINNSLGGFGTGIEVDKSLDLAKSIDAIFWFVPGPGQRTNTAKHLAEAKVVNWFFTAEDDYTGNNRNFQQIGIKMHNDILAAGGVSYLTVFKAGQFINSKGVNWAHGLLARVIFAEIGKSAPIGKTGLLTTETPLGKAGIKNIVTAPGMFLGQYLHVATKGLDISPTLSFEEAQKIVNPVVEGPVTEPPIEVKPDEPVVEPGPVITDPVIEEPAKPYITIDTWNVAAQSQGNYRSTSELQIWWKDGSHDLFQIEKPERVAGVYGKQDKNKDVILTMNYDDGTSKVFGPNKK